MSISEFLQIDMTWTNRTRLLLEKMKSYDPASGPFGSNGDLKYNIARLIQFQLFGLIRPKHRLLFLVLPIKIARFCCLNVSSILYRLESCNKIE
jgi:hypothetical protein